jgi:CRISPR-associated endonuclease/helicase Cas3
MSKLYAHTKNDPKTKKTLPESEWQPLEDHLSEVARIASALAIKFCLEQMAKACGILHDIGKHGDAVQKRLRGSREFADHKSEGACFAIERYGNVFGKLLAYVIFGHHNGLPDDIDINQTFSDTADCLKSLRLSLPEKSTSYALNLFLPPA